MSRDHSTRRRPSSLSGTSIRPSLFAFSNFAVSQIRPAPRGEKQITGTVQGKGASELSDSSTSGAVGVAAKQRLSQGSVSSKERHSRNNKTFLAGLLARWRGEAWKLNPEKVRDSNTGFSRRVVRP